MAEVVRRALDAYLVPSRADAESALATTFGAAPDAESPNRAEWDRGPPPG